MMPDPLTAPPANGNSEDVKDAMAILRFAKWVWRKEHLIPGLLLLILIKDGIGGVIPIIAKFAHLTPEAPAAAAAAPRDLDTQVIPKNRMDRFENRLGKLEGKIDKIAKALEVE